MFSVRILQCSYRKVKQLTEWVYGDNPFNVLHFVDKRIFRRNPFRMHLIQRKLPPTQEKKNKKTGLHSLHDLRHLESQQQCWCEKIYRCLLRLPLKHSSSLSNTDADQDFNRIAYIFYPKFHFSLLGDSDKYLINLSWQKK